MDDEIKVGDTVRVREPRNFKRSFAIKIADRDAVVLELTTGSGGVRQAVVDFQKRNGRGKEFRERMRLTDLVAASQPAQQTEG